MPPSQRETPVDATAGNRNSTSNALPGPKRYIPPFLRNRDVNIASTKEQDKKPLRSMPETLRSVREIQQYYFPGKKSPSHDVATLHDSAQTPGTLRYVLIFHEGNPRWPQDRIIFSKSNLDLLPVEFAEDCTSPPDSTVNDEPQKPAGDLGNASKSIPVAVFEQMKQQAQAYHSSGFEFTGYYRIVKVAFLEPGSPDLLRMLKQKFSHTDRWGQTRAKERSKAKWEESLSKRWAVIKFENDEIADKEIAAPNVPKLELLDPARTPEPSGDKGKSVSELLKEFRMKDLNGEHGDEGNVAQE